MNAPVSPPDVEYCGVRLRDPRWSDRTILLIVVACLCLAIGSAAGGLIEILAHPACVATVGR